MNPSREEKEHKLKRFASSSNWSRIYCFLVSEIKEGGELILAGRVDEASRYTPGQIADIIEDIVCRRTGEFLVSLSYWSGPMVSQCNARFFGREKDFHYNRMPQGSFIQSVDVKVLSSNR